MESLLLPDKGLFIWTLVIFGFSIFLLKKFLWSGILDSIRNQENEVQRAKDLIEENLQSSKDLKEEYERKILELKDHSSALMKEAEKKAAHMHDQLIQASKEEAQRLLDDAKAQIQVEQEIAKKILQEESLKLASLMFKKMVEQESSMEFQSRWLQKFFGGRAS